MRRNGTFTLLSGYTHDFVMRKMLHSSGLIEVSGSNLTFERFSVDPVSPHLSGVVLAGGCVHFFI